MAEIKINFDYDKDADILYITLGTGEPSYCDEVDDIILVERGFITNNITGFRVVGIKHHKIQAVAVGIGKILKREMPPLYPVYFDALKRKLESNRIQSMIHS
jgi:uncharacterized protein YuzE